MTDDVDFDARDRQSSGHRWDDNKHTDQSLGGSPPPRRLLRAAGEDDDGSSSLSQPTLSRRVVLYPGHKGSGHDSSQAPQRSASARKAPDDTASNRATAPRPDNVSGGEFVSCFLFGRIYSTTHIGGLRY